MSQAEIYKYTMPLYKNVEIMASPLSMNTSSKKQHLPHDHPIHQNFEDGMVILNTSQYFFTLPNTLDNHTYIHLVQQVLDVHEKFKKLCITYLDPQCINLLHLHHLKLASQTRVMLTDMQGSSQ